MGAIVYGDETEAEKPKVVAKMETAVVENIQPSPDILKPIIDYHLFYPENANEMHRYHEGIFKVRVNDRDYSLVIERGKIITSNAEVKKELIRQGFIFMYEAIREVQK